MSRSRKKSTAGKKAEERIEDLSHDFPELEAMVKKGEVWPEPTLTEADLENLCNQRLIPEKIIGDWKAHVRRLPERLKGSSVWVEYNGISNHKKLLDSNANFEEFDVSTPDHRLRIKAQTLRLYNPESHQWSIYLVDLDKGTLEIPPVVGQFDGKRGEFYNQQIWEGRAVLVRYVWLDLSPKSSRMEQSFSADGGKTWEVNWICELSR